MVMPAATRSSPIVALLPAYASAARAAMEREQQTRGKGDPRALRKDGIDGRESRKPAQRADGLFGCDPAHGSNRLLRVICDVRRDDHVAELKQRVGRAPVSLLGRLLLDVV